MYVCMDVQVGCLNRRVRIDVVGCWVVKFGTVG